MVLHKHWSISLNYLAKLQDMTKGKLTKLIEGHNLFLGLPKKRIEQENKKIYARINSKESKRLTSKAKS